MNHNLVLSGRRKLFIALLLIHSHPVFELMKRLELIAENLSCRTCHSEIKDLALGRELDTRGNPKRIQRRR